MEYHPEGANLPPSVTIIFLGDGSSEEQPASLLSLTAQGAQLVLLRKTPVWIGRFLALRIGDLPAIPADVRAADDLSLTIAFRADLHESVFLEARQLLEQQQSGNADG